MKLTPEHEQIRDTVKRFVVNELNPQVPEWEKAQQYPAHQVMKRLGDLGPAGAEVPRGRWRRRPRLQLLDGDGRGAGHCDCGGVPMAIGVQTDMATPALARFGSDELRKRVPGAGDRRRHGRLHRRQRGRRRLRRGGGEDHRAQGRRRLRDQRQQDVDHQRPAGRLVLPAGQHQRRRAAQEQEPDHRADGRQGHHQAEDPQDRHVRSATPRSSSSTTCACRGAT